MRHSTLLRFFSLSFLFALLLGGASFYALRAVDESSTTEVRRHMALFIAQAIESGPYAESIQAHRFKAEGRHAGIGLWVFSRVGQVLASNGEAQPPLAWESLQKPTATHELTVHYRPFRLVPDLTLVKLDGPSDAYLLIESRRRSTFGGGIWVPLAFCLFVIGVAVLIGLAMSYAYIRRKSIEAREVLSRLEKGDLKARFEINRIDEIGSLMHDFNRMASEIERLVHRVKETETTRKNLLEELSHDIRTPLTSLKTSIETLSEHFEEMPVAERRELLGVSRAELAYFLHLIDDLFFIADLGEPRYKKTTREIDLEALLSEETRSRQAQERRPGAPGENRIRWELDCSGAAPGAARILGDPLLIQRLLKNALDNAAKHARTAVRIELVPSGAAVRVAIEDDGPGIGDEAIACFGLRKRQRLPARASDPALSLGLGSVIMKTILELHGGDLDVRRVAHGTRLGLVLPVGLIRPKDAIA